MKFTAHPVPRLNGKPLVENMWVSDCCQFRFVITKNECGYVPSFSNGTRSTSGMKSQGFCTSEDLKQAKKRCQEKFDELMGVKQ